ncbi:hypothetical protein YC2023_101563 [Brassica napus]
MYNVVNRGNLLLGTLCFLGLHFTWKKQNVSLCLSSSSNRLPGVHHSTFESLGLGRSSQSIASDFLRLWDSLNFKKDREFVGITVIFLDEKVLKLVQDN